MEYEIISNSDELTHWGVRGMKWGIRRYQNKDGSLTTAGRKRYNEELRKVREQEKTMKNREAVKGRMDRLKARQDAVAARKKALDEAEGKKSNILEKLKQKSSEKKGTDGDEAAKQKPAKKKAVKDMTDEELTNQIRRIQMEKQYDSLTAQPETVKKGNGFVKDFMQKAAVPAIQQAGQQLIKDKLIDIGKKKLGLNSEATKSVVDTLKEEYNTLNYQDKIRDLREKNAARQAAKQEANAKSESKPTNATTSSSNPVTKQNVSSGQNFVNNNVSYYRNINTTSNVSAGQSFVGRYDRAAIAGMDDD